MTTLHLPDDLGLHIAYDSWAPMQYGAYAALVHAHRAMFDGWIFAANSYSLAIAAGIIFG